MSDLMSPSSPKVERSSNLTILTFTAHAIRDVESVIARELGTLTADARDQHLLLDFTHVEYLNSMELSTLITLYKQVRAAGGRLTVFNLRARMFKLFSMTRLDTLLEICREAIAEQSCDSPGAPVGVHPVEA